MNSPDDPKGPKPRVLTLREFEDISSWEGLEVRGRLTARIVQTNGRIFLDLREWQTTASSSGFTSKGIRLMIKDIKRLETILPEATEEIKKRLLLEKTQRDYNAMRTMYDGEQANPETPPSGTPEKPAPLDETSTIPKTEETS